MNIMFSGKHHRSRIEGMLSGYLLLLNNRLGPLLSGDRPGFSPRFYNVHSNIDSHANSQYCN
jgi:hypothetical protein